MGFRSGLGPGRCRRARGGRGMRAATLACSACVGCAKKLCCCVRAAGGHVQHCVLPGEPRGAQRGGAGGPAARHRPVQVRAHVRPAQVWCGASGAAAPPLQRPSATCVQRLCCDLRRPLRHLCAMPPLRAPAPLCHLCAAPPLQPWAPLCHTVQRRTCSRSGSFLCDHRASCARLETRRTHPPACPGSPVPVVVFAHSTLLLTARACLAQPLPQVRVARPQAPPRRGGGGHQRGGGAAARH